MARSDGGSAGVRHVIGETGAALEKTKGGASAASLAFQELTNQLDRVKLGLKEGTLSQSQYEAELVGLKAAVQEVGQAHSLSAGEQRTFQRLLSQTTVTVRPATEAMAALENQIAVLQGAAQRRRDRRRAVQRRNADGHRRPQAGRGDDGTECRRAAQVQHALTQTTTEVHPKPIQGIGNVRVPSPRWPRR
jgi:hypothetical protein